MNNKKQYDQEYYRSHCGDEYKRGNGWKEVFGNYAERIVKEIRPEKTLDVGCAIGFFVEALRDHGVEAYGIDISEYAISNVREDIKDFCKVQSALLPIQGKYDLITCIEVLEHLDNKDIPLAIEQMCKATDDIIFSSTPFDYDEESHISVHTPEYWVEQFAYNGFYHDVAYDCSYIAVQTMRFRRMKKDKIELIREYEHEIFQKQQEIVAVRRKLNLSNENMQIYKDAYQKHVDMINEELNPKIQNLEIEKENIKNEAKRSVEAQCRKLLEEEVKKRKNIEEKYYQSRIEKTELDQVRRVNRILEDEMDNVMKNSSRISLFAVVKKWYKDKKQERVLLKKPVEYWKPVFDAKFYASHNQDICETFGISEKNLLKHFITDGMYEGRVANEEFDINVYRQCNPDVVEVYKYDKRKCYLHYIEYGRLEGRRTK